MQVQYRALEESEIGAAADVFLTTVSDMARRNGLTPPTQYNRANLEPRFAHLRRTGIFNVAEIDGQLAAICAAIVRGPYWFLSMFWTLPEWQQRGIGRPLLREVWRQGRERGALIDFTWSSIDFAALGAYMKLGMLPLCQNFTFAGAALVEPRPPTGYALEPLALDSACRLDAHVRGTARELDHEHWLSGAGVGQQVRAQGDVVGYFYVQEGAIGPAAWSEPRHAVSLIQLALGAASQQHSEIKLMTPAVNRAGVRAAVDAGLRVVATAHLMCNERPGILEQYLPSGPMLF